MAADSLARYLADRKYIDWQSKTVQQKSAALTRGLTKNTDKAKVNSLPDIPVITPLGEQ
ncbi:hypothetical protein [uncultured Gilvimarinus sp.]|uniref:hypothetical protein n=1 Tax=uncultured Gilvimarinus sp. TaxID=1689143 RepID=UPI0030EE0C69|tara:strand:+ start:552 stop:728 length:177 start_codon:yes stop_codon:yes gene_type:complete